MFGFPKVPHKTFNSNFLKTVIFQVKFEKNNHVDTKRDEIKSIFKKDFPVQNDTKSEGVEISLSNTGSHKLNRIKEIDGIELKSEDGQKVIAINETSFSLTVTGKVYKDYFQFKRNHFENLTAFFILCRIESVTRVAVRKINVVEFSRKEVLNPSEVLKILINPSLISNLNSLPNSEKIINNIHSINYQEGFNFLNLKYGFNLPPRNENIGQIVIDIDLFQQDDTKQEKISNTLDHINSEIFNIFNWAISPKTLNMLERN